MLRAWTRCGQIEMIGELTCLERHAEVLASQERARGRRGTMQRLSAMLKRSHRILADLETDLKAGADARMTGNDVATLHGLATSEIAKAEEAGLLSARGANPKETR